jgi:MOSC domain-containing protein YiiM|tara:strand:+ start:330 stop:761 length:432 start_codon:yes stop_codon:yes gene_type:complete
MGQVLGIFVSDGGVPKLAVESAEITASGLLGDKQADKKHHGGEMKAVCVLENEILTKLQSEGHPIMPGTTGENLLVEGFNLGIGTIFTVGDSELEVVSAATPCKTIEASFIDGYFNRLSHKKYPGETRWYCRVIRAGTVRKSG